jgi:hypothetical protein
MALLLHGCYRPAGSGVLEAELLANNQMRLRNGSDHNILVPLYNGTLSFTEQAIYSLNGCNLVDIESVSTEPLMYIEMDTLQAGNSKTYDVRFFNSDPTLPYDSQLVFTFTLYDQTLYGVFKYNIESQRLLYITSYRDKQGKVAFSDFSALVPATTDINALQLNICADK